MQQRQYDRIAAGISIALLAGLAAVSYYLAELSVRFERPDAVGTPTHEPDYFVEGLALTRLNREGQPVFRMSADRMVHYPDDDSSEFTRPTLVSLDPGKPLVTLRAQRGVATSAGQQTHLYDAVRLTRAAHGDQPPLRIDTDYVLVLPDEDIARTDRPVTIAHGASSLTGIGMEFDNAARVLKVRSRVKGVWAAPAPR